MVFVIISSLSLTKDTLDPVFQATQDIGLNSKLISSADSTVLSCESELSTLNDLSNVERSFWGLKRKATSDRKEYLLKKMRIAQAKIQALEKQNTLLKKALAKGG